MQRSLSKSEPSIISLKFQPILDNSWEMLSIWRNLRKCKFA
jgi:hypothetical protein